MMAKLGMGDRADVVAKRFAVMERRRRDYLTGRRRNTTDRTGATVMGGP